MRWMSSSNSHALTVVLAPVTPRQSPIDGHEVGIDESRACPAGAGIRRAANQFVEIGTPRRCRFPSSSRWCRNSCRRRRGFSRSTSPGRKNSCRRASGSSRTKRSSSSRSTRTSPHDWRRAPEPGRKNSCRRASGSSRRRVVRCSSSRGRRRRPRVRSSDRTVGSSVMESAWLYE